MVKLSKEELERYSRQMILPQVGKTNQERLKKGRVLVIGAGGLGSPALLYLAAAGVGQIGIVDFDTISLSNLHRQILFSTNDIGQKKVSIAKRSLLALNPHCQIDEYPVAITSLNALELIAPYDVILDGSDNFATRYLVDDACVILGKPLVYGSVFRFEGQASVFNQEEEGGSRSACYRDLYPTPPEAGTVPNCAESGVVGTLPGIVGSMQANEAIKLLIGMTNHTLKNKLLTFDALTLKTSLFGFSKDANRPATTLLLDSYEAFCGESPSLEINAHELKAKLSHQEAVFILDVREPVEYDGYNIGGVNIPQSEVLDNLHLIPQSNLVVAVCTSGARSKSITEKLSQKGYTNVVSLKGGLGTM